MLIAVDASHLNPSNMSGTQNYLYKLLESISAIDTKNEYHVLSRFEFSSAFFNTMVSSNPKFHYHYLKKRFSWTQQDLASYLLSADFDILLSPWQTIPIIHKPSLKIVSIIHGLEYSKFAFGPTLYTSTFSDQLIAVSEFTKKQLMSKFFTPSSKIEVIYEGVDTSVFSPASSNEIDRIRAKYGIEGNYIFFVGNMVPRKNVPRMLSAFDIMLQESGLEYTFVLAGSIPQNSQVPKFAKGLKNGHKVRFLGYVPSKDLPALISGAYFMSYVSESEGFGLPVLESQACGTAVLTSDQGALPEVALDSAYLVNPLDINSIKQGMLNLVTNPSLVSSLVKAGNKNVLRFTWEDTAKQVLKVLNNIF